MTFYGSAAAFETYHEARGRTISASWTDAVIEAALLVSSEWLDGKYSNVWSGYATDGFTQVRQWPRTTAVTNTFPQYVFSTSEIPDNVVYATYEAAFRELTTSGSLQKDFTPSKYNKVSISGATSVEYNSAMNQSSDIQLQIPFIESLMEPLINLSSQGSFSFFSGGVSRV